MPTSAYSFLHSILRETRYYVMEVDVPGRSSELTPACLVFPDKVIAWLRVLSELSLCLAGSKAFLCIWVVLQRHVKLQNSYETLNVPRSSCSNYFPASVIQIGGTAVLGKRVLYPHLQKWSSPLSRYCLSSRCVPHQTEMAVLQSLLLCPQTPGCLKLYWTLWTVLSCVFVCDKVYWLNKVRIRIREELWLYTLIKIMFIWSLKVS